MVVHNDKWHNKNKYKYLKKHNLLGAKQTDDHDKNRQARDKLGSNQDRYFSDNEDDLSDESEETGKDPEGIDNQEGQDIEFTLNLDQSNDDLSEINDKLRKILLNKSQLNEPILDSNQNKQLKKQGKFYNPDDLLNWSLNGDNQKSINQKDSKKSNVFELSGDDLIQFNDLQNKISLIKSNDKLKSKLLKNHQNKSKSKVLEINSNSDNYIPIVNQSLLKNIQLEKDLNLDDNLDFLLNHKPNTEQIEENNEPSSDLLDDLINNSKTIKSSNLKNNIHTKTDPVFKVKKKQQDNDAQDQDESFLDDLLN